MRIWRKKEEREHEREKRETKIMQYVVHTLQILELAVHLQICIMSMHSFSSMFHMYINSIPN